MRKKLQQKKLLLRLLGLILVVVTTISLFLPLIKMTKTEEALGVTETVTARFSVFQIMTQDDKISLSSKSVLGEFNNFAFISIAELMGGKQIALIITLALAVLAILFVLWGIGILIGVLLNHLRRGTIRNFLLYYLFLWVFSLVVASVSKSGFEFAPPIIPIIIILVVSFGTIIIVDHLLTGISNVSTEIFVSKYNKEDVKWLETFIGDFSEYCDDANIEIPLDCLVRFLDIVDRKIDKKSDPEENDGQ